MDDDFQSLSTRLYELLSSQQENVDDKQQRIQKTLIQLVLPWTFPGIQSQKSSNALQTTLTQVFDWLIQNWLNTIPSTSLAQNRVSTEESIKRVALDLYLSSIGSCSEKEQTRSILEATNSSIDRNANHTNLTLRTRNITPSSGQLLLESPNAKARLNQSSRPNQNPSSNRNLRGQHQSSQSALQTSSIPDSTLRTIAKTEEDPSVIRLRRYISLDPLERLPPAAGKVLAHWKLDSDPSLYDWDATSRELEVPDSDEATWTSRSQQQRQKKKRNRAETVSQPQASRGRLWGSSPGPMAAPVVASSSQAVTAAPDAIPATQEERGVFGSRRGRVVQTPKKKRRAGF
jgi:RNA polymerase I-specific transcription initiation factor RRN6